MQWNSLTHYGGRPCDQNWHWAHRTLSHEHQSARGSKINVAATHSFPHIIISYISDSYTVVRGTCENSGEYSEYFALIGDFKVGCIVERNIQSQNWKWWLYLQINKFYVREDAMRNVQEKFGSLELKYKWSCPSTRHEVLCGNNGLTSLILHLGVGRR